MEAEQAAAAPSGQQAAESPESGVCWRELAAAGVGHVNATLPAEGAVTVFGLLDLLAQVTDRPGDGRGIDARHAAGIPDDPPPF